ncbi:WD40-repeat-containing domain protein [Lipomyces japonicus]|uniref:WD40-repeat-containing domain protein n=1 Tax=Lipomyces japonicus TaxID=56871 RepID=UPI0034CEB487
MFSFRTTGFNGYAVQYSPFFDTKLACAASANFGLVGNGRLYVLGLTSSGIVAEKWFDTQDGLFDCAWSESHENQVVVATGDGSIKLFDILLNDYPVQNWREHGREVFSVNWNLVGKTTFCTSSWDGLIKIWAPNRSKSIATLRPPQGVTPSCTYSASFSPYSATVMASCSSDSIMRFWDPRAGEYPTNSVMAHNGAEILSLDWNRYRPDVIATSSVDKTIKVWDMRFLGAATAGGVAHASPVNEFVGHAYAVRKIAWSPHDPDLLLSASYDMTARVWQDNTAFEQRDQVPITRGQQPNHNQLRGVWDRHSEFVVGCDWSLWGTAGWVATTGWDEMVYVWDVRCVLR